MFVRQRRTAANADTEPRVRDGQHRSSQMDRVNSACAFGGSRRRKCRQLGTNVRSGTQDEVGGLLRPVPHRKVAGAVEPVELGGRKALYGSRRLPRQAQPVPAAPSDHQPPRRRRGPLLDRSVSKVANQRIECRGLRKAAHQPSIVALCRCHRAWWDRSPRAQARRHRPVLLA